MNDFATVDRLVNEHMPLAHAHAARWALILGYNEALGVALSKLQNAASQYTGKNGSSFKWFADFCIKNGMLNERTRLRTVGRGGRFEHVSADSPTSDGSTSCLLDVIVDDDGKDAAVTLLEADTARQIRALLATLDDRSRDIMERRFGLNGNPPETLESIGRRYGVQKSQTLRLVRRALERLRDRWPDQTKYS